MIRAPWKGIALLLVALQLACGKDSLKSRKAQTAADPCPPIAGQALPVQGVRMRSAMGSGAFTGVLTSERELAASGYIVELGGPIVLSAGEPPPEPPRIDFTKQRLAYLLFPQRPGASVAWVVETPTEIVVGVRVDAYCGGAAPPDGLAATLVPASAKAVRFAQCSVGSCDPSVLAP
ncbi:hypothetical protein BH11MYX4_BH11MYX4_32540 [soil metagenome]